MTWIVGIDEAGYGPNLGPLVMTGVACRVPEELVAVSLWRRLRQAVCDNGPWGTCNTRDRIAYYIFRLCFTSNWRSSSRSS